MNTLPTSLTLLDEWQWRRDRLSRSPGGRAPSAREQIKVLDYLIRRYHDSPEAQRLAPVRPLAEFRVNQRAIVVHHHVWEGRIGGVKNVQEAEARVSAIVKRITSHASSDASKSGAAAACAYDDQEADDRIDPGVWGGILNRIRKRTLRGGDEAIAAALAKNPVLPHSVAQLLYHRIVKPGTDDESAAELLAQGRSRAARNYAVYAWQELVAAGRKNRAWAALKRFLAAPEPSATVAQEVRNSLAHGSPRVRLAALEILARIGDLEDIGLLCDLLNLPAAADEVPEERPALLRAMRAIAETTRA